jgi:prolipoprotein diacylglyceryl transferase
MHSFIPTPSKSFLELGPLTIHFYALCILLGVIAALAIGKRRYLRFGGNAADISDLALWTIPAGIIGGRIYHVITSPQAYFGATGKPLDAFKIWQGGLGIWGAVSLGVLVAYLRFKRLPKTVSFGVFADSFAPALLVAQGIGRWGNWFNGELFGSPTKLPWGLQIPFQLRPSGYENFTTYHPTFLYESLWCFGAALLLVSVTYFKNLPPGYLFIAYISLYTLGRTWIEVLRIDTATHIFGLRINIWVSAITFLISTFTLIRVSRTTRFAETVD